MTLRRPGAVEEGEDGIVIALVSLLMVALLVVTALVVDVGLTRTVRRDARSVADAAVTAGSLDLDKATSADACAATLQYAFINLELTAPASISSSCSTTMAATCSATTAARTVTASAGGTTVSFTHPVPDGHPFLRPTVIAGGTSQAVSTTDRDRCVRLGVQIDRPQSRVLGGITSRTQQRFRVHAVAVYDLSDGPGSPLPPVVALNRSACRAFDTGSGGITVTPDTSATFPGSVVSDSDGSACTSGNAVLYSRASGRLIAEQLNPSTPGELNWFQAPATTGYLTSSSTSLTGTTTNYVGSLSARTERVTNVGIHQKYRCTQVPTSVQPLCATSTDALFAALGTAPNGLTAPSHLSATAAPALVGWTTLGCTLPPVLPPTNVYVNCPAGVSVPSTLTWLPIAIAEPVLIFNGPVNITSGARFFINTTTSSGDPVVATGSSAQPLVIIRGNLSLQSGGSLLSMARTTIVSNGRIDLQGTPSLLWSPPTLGLRAGLIYWTTSTTTASPISLSGSPTIFAAGVLYAGGPIGTPASGAAGIPLSISGGGSINIRRVQLWVDSVVISGGGGITLQADPGTAFKLGRPASRLIR